MLHLPFSDPPLKKCTAISMDRVSLNTPEGNNRSPESQKLLFRGTPEVAGTSLKLVDNDVLGLCKAQLREPFLENRSFSPFLL